jgi:hypothetical protein
MKFKLDFTSKSNRLALAIGTSILVGTIVVLVTSDKTCFNTWSDGTRYYCLCTGEEDVRKYDYNFANGLISGLMTFSIFLILNSFVKKEE